MKQFVGSQSAKVLDGRNLSFDVALFPSRIMLSCLLRVFQVCPRFCSLNERVLSDYCLFQKQKETESAVQSKGLFARLTEKLLFHFWNVSHRNQGGDDVADGAFCHLVPNGCRAMGMLLLSKCLNAKESTCTGLAWVSHVTSVIRRLFHGSENHITSFPQE